MTNCTIAASEISSQSLCHLIAEDNDFNQSSRTLISAPSLVSLQLNDFWGRTPVLQSMPLLATALVELDVGYCHDICDNSSSENCGYEDCEGCDCSDGCVLLRGLSNATDLMLFADPRVFIFKRDLTLCPTFSNLKTLLLNEWSVAVDLSSVVCLLQHSPVLEKLTFRLYQVPEHQVEMDGSQNPAEPFTHLKTVEIESLDVEERVQELLKSLIFCGVPAEVIKIKERSSHSYSCYSRSDRWYKELSF